MMQEHPIPARKRRRRGAVGLGRNQKLVLWLLADRGKSVQDMACDHMPGLDENAIRGALNGLTRRGLVDRVDMDFYPRGGGRPLMVFGLTDKGHEAVQTITVDV